MANLKLKHPKNVPGTFFTTHPDDPNGEGCIACNVCYSSAPDFFKEDEDGNGYIYRQPVTPQEISDCVDQLDSCPVGAIGKEAV